MPSASQPHAKQVLQERRAKVVTATITQDAQISSLFDKIEQ